MTIKDLSWIDKFIKRVKKHIFVRQEDSVLILPPNRVYKLNKTALGLLKLLLAGKKIKQLKNIITGKRIKEVHYFFCDLKAFYQGCTAFIRERKAVQTITFDFNFTSFPVLGEIAVTYRCNNRCAFCYLGYNKQNKAAATMDLQNVKRVIDIFQQQAQIPFFSFTGGEPLLCNDLEKMIDYAVKKGLGVNLITNAVLVDKNRARSLYKSGLRTAQVSLESHDPFIHDRLTGVAGSFEKTIKGIAYLKQAGISVQTNTTLNKKNVESIIRLPGFLRTIGIQRFSMNLYIPAGEGCNHHDLLLPYSECGYVIEKIKKVARALNLTFFWYSPIPHCYYNPIARGLGNKSCAAMDGLLSVSPIGDVLPCSSYNEPIGNILNQEFRQIWFSQRARYFKQKKYVPAECKACENLIACQAACPLYWQYVGTAELKQKNRLLRREKQGIMK